jgi:IclR family acetate operon transcriptional repressor
MGKTQDYTIGSVKRALEILKLFGDCNSSLTLSELSKMSGIGKSSMLRVLYTLVNEDFVSYDEESKRYSLGIEIYRLGMNKYNTLELDTIIHKHLRKLSDATDMICYLGVRQGDILLMVDQVVPRSVPTWMQLMTSTGGISQLYSTGIGRLFLAQNSDDEVEAYLNRVEIKKFTEDTVTDKATLLELVREARRERFSGCIGENEPYIYSLCAPVYDVHGIMRAGISLCGLKDVLSSDHYDDYVSLVRQTAIDISRETGYAGS